MILNRKIKKVSKHVNELNAIYDISDVNEAFAPLGKDLCVIGPCYQEADVVVQGTVGAGSDLYALATITARDFNGGLAYTVQVPVTAGDIFTVITTKIANALNTDSVVTDFFSVVTTGAKIFLITKTMASFDSTMLLDINNGNSTGVSHTTSITYQPLVHSKILSVPQGWNGYKYWMVVTPLPLGTSGGNNAYENPCIYASNDLSTWVTPAGVTNPIVAKPDGSYYNSDPTLTLGLDGVTVWLTYRYVGAFDQIITMSTTDGFKTLSSPTAIVTNSTPLTERDVSPEIQPDKINNQYVMWTVNIISSPTTLVRRTCSTMNGTWSDPTVCTIALPTGNYLWHPDITKLGETYYMMVHCSATNGSGGNGKFFFGSSPNGITWTMGNQICITPPSAGIYKGTLLPTITDKGIAFHFWYTMITSSGGNALYHTMLTFNRTRRNLDYRNDLISGINLLSPALFCDLFGTDASFGTSTCGKIWTASLATFTTLSRWASPSSATNTIATYNLGVTDFYASMKIGSIASDAWLLVRFTSTSGGFLRFGCASGVHILQQGGTQIIQLIGAAIIGDVLGIMCKGDTISLYVNGELRAVVTNSFNDTSTIFGIQASTTGAKIGEVFVKSLN